MAKKLLQILVAFALFCGVAFADALVLKNNHPKEYTVVEGDTLWDISGKFLRDPWDWPELWRNNPNIENPHLIYPGDVMALVMINGKPALSFVNRQNSGASSVSAITPLPRYSIKTFFNKSLVIEEGDLKNHPYVVAHGGEHIITGVGDRIYVKGLEGKRGQIFTIVRPGEPFVDPETKEYLGFHADYIGDAKVERTGDTSTLKIIASRKEILVGDRLMLREPSSKFLNFAPHKPRHEVNGQILSILDSINQGGKNNVVVINRGQKDGFVAGDVVAVYSLDEHYKQAIYGKKEELVDIPEERIAEVMVYRCFNRVSFALVMNTENASVRVYDRVRNP